MILINKNSFYILILISTFIKILFSYYYGDNSIDMEWSVINNNLINYGSYSYYVIEGERIPTVYMPPLYTYFLYSFSFLGLDNFLTVKLILLIQCIISSFSIIIFFKLLSKFFNQHISRIVSLIYLFFPLNFYAPSQISSVTLQVFLFLVFIYLIISPKKYKEFIILGIFSGLLILIRGEFWPLFLILIIFKLLKNPKQIIKIILCLLMVVCIVSPKIVSNYKKFDQIILTKSFGYNLWRGNNDELNINGSNIDMTDKKILNIFFSSKYDLKKFEIFLDEYFLDIAKKNITSNPSLYTKHYFDKFFAFSIFNYKSTYPNYFNPLIFIPELIISIFALLGIIMNIFYKRNYELLILILYYLFLIPIFFILPRYKLFILPLYFIFAGQLFIYLNKIFSKKQ